MEQDSRITLDSLWKEGAISRLEEDWRYMLLELRGDTLHIGGGFVPEREEITMCEYHYWLEWDQAQRLLEALETDFGGGLETLTRSARPDLHAQDPFGEYLLEHSISHRYSVSFGDVSFL